MLDFNLDPAFLPSSTRETAAVETPGAPLRAAGHCWGAVGYSMNAKGAACPDPDPWRGPLVRFKELTEHE